MSCLQIVADDYGIAEVLLKLFSENGYCAEIVKHPTPTADGVILLNTIKDFKNIDAAIANNYQAFHYAKAIAPQFSKHNRLFIAVQNTGGCFGLKQTLNEKAWGAGISGLVKSLRHEWPTVAFKVIDLEVKKSKPAVLAQKLFEEIIEGDSHCEVGLRENGERILLKPNLITDAVNEKNICLQPNDVMVVTGGARGVTADCLLALAQKIKLRFVLIGRTAIKNVSSKLLEITDEKELQKYFIKDAQSKGEKPSIKTINKKINEIKAIQEIQSTLNKLKSLGSESIYISCDIVKLNSIKNTINQIKEAWGNIHAFVHGAGVLADRLLIDKTDEQFDYVFSTKIIGLKNLLSALEGQPLKYIGLFSSIAARVGNKGQTDYAMANEVLNKVAQALQQKYGPSCLVKSYNWGAWDGGMVTEALKKNFQEQGVSLLPREQGAQAFVDELYRNKNSSTEIIVSDLWPLPKTFVINKRNYPFLEDHKISGKVVLPICLVMELFAETIADHAPELNYLTFYKVNVLKGIRLENFEQNTVVKVVYKIIEDNKECMKFSLALLNENQQTCCKAELEKTLNPQSKRLPIELANLEPWPYQKSEIYDGKKGLFHKEQFHVISKLLGFNKEGGTGSLMGVEKMQWNKRLHWYTDVALLDGVLQLLLLWNPIYLKQKTLPIYIERFSQYITEPIKDIILCEFKSQMIDQLHTVHNAQLIYKEQVIAEIKGIKTYIYNYKE